MSNTLLLKRSGVANTVPSTGNLALGELAINTFDGKLYTKIDNGVVSVVELTQNQTITLTGDVTGSGYSTINTTLANTAVTAGTYGNASAIPQFTVDSKGRITNATSFTISTSSISNGTSNISIPVANGPIFMSAAGVANVVGINLGGGEVSGFWSVSGNVTGGNVTSNALLSSATLSVTGNANVGNLGTTGLIVATGNVTGGNLTTGGILSVTGNANIGNIGTTGIYTNGLYYANGSPWDFITPAGANTQIQFNDGAGNLGASAAFTFDTASNVLSLTGNANVGNIGGTNAVFTNLTGTLTTAAQPNVTSVGTLTSLTTSGNVLAANVNSNASVTGVTGTFSGNVSGGNLTTAGAVVATGNITGGNISTTGSGGNISGANVVSATTFTATANVSAGNLVSSGILSVTGNANVGNLGTSGNITASYFLGNGSQLTGVVAASANAETLTGTFLANNVVGSNLTSVGTLTSLSVTGNISGGNVSGTLLTGTLTTAAQPNVTSVGTLTSLSVTGNVTGGNISAGSGIISTTGNVSGGNIVSPIVTGGAGTLTLNATGDVIFAQSGNINATTSWINNLVDPVQAQDAATKQYVDDAVSTGITIHTPVRVESPTDIGGTYAQGGTTATVTDTVAGNIVVFGSAISPQVNDQYWFSNSFNGVVANTPYFVVSAPNTSAAVLSLSYSGSPVTTITSGSGLTQGLRINSGQGATLTNNGANATLVIDGVTLSNTNRVLIYQQANAVHNGVYVVSEAGNATTAWQLTRSSDMDTYAPDDIDGLDAGDYFYVQEGDTGAGESYVMTAPIGPTIIGFANLTFTQFSASQVYTANTAAGLVLNGTVFSAKVDGITTAFDGTGNISVKASANLTTPNIGAATGTSLSATGNVSGGNLITAGNVYAPAIINNGTYNTKIELGAASGIITVTTDGNSTQFGPSGTITLGGASQIVGGSFGGSGITLGTSQTDLFQNRGGNVTVQVGAGGTIANTWTFAQDGSFTSPGNITTTANISAGYFLGNANVGTLTVSTLANITATTGATSTTTGALQVAGGLGVVGNIYGGDIYKNGVIVINANDTVDGGTY
jgi:hypothetical protein